MRTSERYTALVDKGHSTTLFPGSLCLSFSPAPERPWERDLSKRDTSLEKPRACNIADACVLIAVMCRNHRYLMGRERVENLSPDLSTSKGQDEERGTLGLSDTYRMTIRKLNMTYLKWLGGVRCIRGMQYSSGLRCFSSACGFLFL